MSNIQISNIMLWQKNGHLRKLDFLHNRINVITGDSGKGKSSILFIIDYCLLASETTGISKTNIDSKVEWYGIKLSIQGKELVIARPAESKNTPNLAYFNEDGIIPEAPHLNVRIENLKKVLNDAFGIDADLRVPYGGRHIRAGSRVSYRNFLAYSYQDQNTIVAPNHLYIRPSDPRFQEAIERTFRMAIGSENINTALSRSQLYELEIKKALQARKNETYERSAHAFNDEVGMMTKEAYSYGIIDNIPETYNDRLSTLTNLLQAPTTPNDYNSEIDSIENEVFKLLAKNRRLQEFIDSKPDYINNLKDIEESLKPVSIFNSQEEKIFPSQLASQVIAHLQRELKDIRSSIRNRKSFPFLEEVKRLQIANEQKIKSLKNEILSLEKQKNIRQSSNEYYRYLGRLEAKLEIYRRFEKPSNLLSQENLDEAISNLRSIVDQNEEITSLSKQELNRLINKRLSNLPLKGYEDFFAYYYEKEKVIHLHSPDLSQIEKMPDVGSASNYLYLHVAYFLAIHEIAKTRGIPWIPSFLILDQVSTPYFSSDGTPNDDIHSLDKVLIELNKAVIEMDPHGGLQIILLEHINEEYWNKLNLERFHLVDRELRNGHGLITDDH